MMAPQPAMQYSDPQPTMMAQPTVTSMAMEQMPATTFTTAMAPTVMPEPVPSGTIGSYSVGAYGGQTLFVEVVRAMGLRHLNHFTGDHPYVQCEVKHLNRHAKTTRATTKPVTVGDTLNPFWGERLELRPWQAGEDLEFTVYDKGLIGSKTEGKALLPSHMFYPNGFNGNLEISGLPGALLQIAIQPPGGSVGACGMAAPIGAYSMTGPSSGMTYPDQTLCVEVVRAMGLHHLNNFCGDNPYVQCEVKHLNRHARTTRATTKPVTMGDTMNPVWGERLELQPWQPGEDLEFTVYDK